MLLFNLSLRNIKKSFQDYTIYFMTLILGVAIFYIFNSLDSQTAMLEMTSSRKEIVQLLMTMMSGVSVGVAFILGFLIIYASNFLIKRRKKEFAVYMTLGMGRQSISRILLGETLLIGILSLGTGLLVGIFASQFMSILVSKMFEADMSAYTFIFSQPAAIKTIIYFSIMYMMIMIFNVIMVSKYKLIDLYQASKKMEERRLKNSWAAAGAFIVASVILCYCYYQVSVNAVSLNRSMMISIIILGCIGTWGIFWSLSGFLLKLTKRLKRFYHYGLNAFIIRRLNSSINTSVFSMTIICLLFFVTICVLSSGLAMNNALRKDLRELCPRDINLYKDMNEIAQDDEMRQTSVLTVMETLQDTGFDTLLLEADYVEINEYTSSDLTYGTFMGEYKEEIEQQFPLMSWEAAESIVGITEYNKLAEYYGQQTYTLEEGEYIVLCTFDNFVNFRNVVLQDGKSLQIGDSKLQPRYNHCQEGFLYMNVSNINMGVILVPDNVIEKETTLIKETNLLIADYAGEGKDAKRHGEDVLMAYMDSKGSAEGLKGMTKISIYESSIGISSIITFIAIYIGIVFLIAGAALLALKELSDSTDNKERYQVLNKIGADKGMQRGALLCQMGIFFAAPMLLALIHSIFGIQYVHKIMSLFQGKDIIVSIILTASFIIFVFGSYFAATYFGSRRIIEE